MQPPRATHFIGERGLATGREERLGQGWERQAREPALLGPFPPLCVSLAHGAGRILGEEAVLSTHDDPRRCSLRVGWGASSPVLSSSPRGVQGLSGPSDCLCPLSARRGPLALGTLPPPGLSSPGPGGGGNRTRWEAGWCQPPCRKRTLASGKGEKIR